MLGKRSYLKVCILFALLCLVVFVVYNKDYIIKEHLANPPSDLEKKVDDLSTEFKKFKDQASAQSDQAAAAKASLDSIKRS
jgi:outer membrane murein-binding lipoprotein Lpp